MQAIVAGYVPAEVVAVLCAADPAHADARAFLFAAAALDEAAANAGDRLAAVPPARRGFVLATTSTDIFAHFPQ